MEQKVAVRVGVKGQACIPKNNNNKQPAKRTVQNTYVIIVPPCKIVCMSVYFTFLTTFCKEFI